MFQYIFEVNRSRAQHIATSYQSKWAVGRELSQVDVLDEESDAFFIIMLVLFCRFFSYKLPTDPQQETSSGLSWGISRLQLFLNSIWPLVLDFPLKWMDGANLLIIISALSVKCSRSDNAVWVIKYFYCSHLEWDGAAWKCAGIGMPPVMLNQAETVQKVQQYLQSLKRGQEFLVGIATTDSFSVHVCAKWSCWHSLWWKNATLCSGKTQWLDKYSWHQLTVELCETRRR